MHLPNNWRAQFEQCRKSNTLERDIRLRLTVSTRRFKGEKQREQTRGIVPGHETGNILIGFQGWSPCVNEP